MLDSILNSVNKKTLIIMGSSVVGLLIVVVLVSYIVNSLAPSYLSYDKFEEKLSVAAKNYYIANPTLLPTSDGETTLLYSTLEENGYMKPIVEMLEKGENCSAQVIVSKYSENFSYIPYLTCPGDYETKELYRAVLENNKTVTEGKGLYRGSDSYYFRGEVTNNYVQLGESIWKIVKINNDNSMTIIQSVALDDYIMWDNRYNIEENSKDGVNDFEVSRIKETLQELAAGSLIFTDTIKGKLTARNLCIEKRSTTDTDTTGSIECSLMSKDKYLLGLITASEFMAASLDENCTSTNSRSCANYNFLSTYRNSSWTLTAATENTKNVFFFNRNGLRASMASIEIPINLTAFISKRAYYKSGKGTKEDPYIVR